MTLNGPIALARMPANRRLAMSCTALVLLLLTPVSVSAQNDPLAAGFASPPPETRPLVYWQWVNGNVSEGGIRLDLEWMQRVGLGGVMMMEVGFRTPPVPQFVDQRVAFGTPEWDSAVRFTGAEARRLGLSFGAQSSGGWSVSGGPDVPPEDGMKKLVWSETIVSAETTGAVRLPSPPVISGPFQTVPIGGQFHDPVRSGEVAVIAYRLPDLEQQADRRAPVLTANGDTGILQDGLYDVTTTYTPDDRGEVAIEARFAPGTAPRSVTLAVEGALPVGAVEVRGADSVWTPVVTLPGTVHLAAPVRTLSLPEVAASDRWRVRFTGLTRPLGVSEVRFDEAARVNQVEEKAGYGVLTDYDVAATPAVASAATVRPDAIVDLSARMAADGTLDWKPDAGRWAVLRFGWSLTGRRVTPAPAESLGLEVDKLDPDAVRRFAERFYGRFETAVGDGVFDIAVTDSWEAGQQTWTPTMLAEFTRRRGYDPRPWLPVVTGRIVGDPALSDRFLADWRRTIADMLADNHYGVLADVARSHGRTLYAEAAGTDLPTVIDGLQAKGRVDVPMGEYWYWPEGGEPKSNHVADIREAASAAHLHGRNLVAAEALTTQGEAPWSLGPTQLRRMVDRFFAEGVNAMVLHTSAHQPFAAELRPGVTLRQYGQHFTRNETWAEDAGPWLAYLARTSFLLRQGQPVADVAVFTGEGAASGPRFDVPGALDRPTGFDYDFIDAETLISRAQVRDGRLVVGEGAGYRLLVLPPSVKRMSLKLATRLQELVTAGAVIVGAPPVGAEGLADSDEAVLDVVRALWGGAGAAPAVIGAGRVYRDISASEALTAEGMVPDVAAPDEAPLHWTHRRSEDADIYFLTNQGAGPLQADLSFRVAGRRAEIWNAVDGSRRPAPYRTEGGGTVVAVDLPAHGSTFVVFRDGQGPAVAAPLVGASTEIARLDADWQVAFEGQGAPARTRFAGLTSWTDNADAAIRYYSGRAVYSRTFDIGAEHVADGRRVELDLGQFAEMARVIVNGRDLGFVWTEPHRLDVTDALKPGQNTVEIVVTNYWLNRMVGDAQPGAQVQTFATIRPFTAGTPLRPSGLLGPVRLIAVEPRP